MSDDILALARAALEDDAQPCQVINLASCVCGRGTKSCVTHHGLREHALAREVIRLTGCLIKANDNHEKFERLWYLTQDERDQLRAEVAALRDVLITVRYPLAVAASYLDDKRISIGLRLHAESCVACLQAIDAAAAKETK